MANPQEIGCSMKLTNHLHLITKCGNAWSFISILEWCWVFHVLLFLYWWLLIVVFPRNEHAILMLCLSFRFPPASFISKVTQWILHLSSSSVDLQFLKYLGRLTYPQSHSAFFYVRFLNKKHLTGWSA
jgi:hypothetical protein